MKAPLIAFFILEILFFIVGLSNIFVFKISRKAFVLFSPLIVTGILGLILLVLTMRYQVSGTLRVFLLLAGTAPSAMFISILLHNLISGAIMKITGGDFEDAIFFILAIFVCPAAFIAGTVGTIVLMIKNAIVR